MIEINSIEVITKLFMILFWKMQKRVSGEDAPWGGVEVVGAVAEVVGKPEGMVAEGDEHRAFGGIKTGEGFAPQIAQGGRKVEGRFWESPVAQGGGHGQRVEGHLFLALERADFHTCVDYVETAA